MTVIAESATWPDAVMVIAVCAMCAFMTWVVVKYL